MLTLKPPSSLENVASNPITQSVFAMITTTVPLAALLPVLAATLAATRHMRRIEDALLLITETLNKQGKAIESISDDQYKLINEIVVTLLNTVDSEKISILKDALHNTLENPTI